MSKKNLKQAAAKVNSKRTKKQSFCDYKRLRIAVDAAIVKLPKTPAFAAAATDAVLANYVAGRLREAAAQYQDHSIKLLAKVAR